MDWQLTTDNDGKFQMVIPRRTLEHSRYTLTASFAGDNYYTRSSKEVSFSVLEDLGVYSLNLTGTPVIINGDTDTITATLLRDDIPVMYVELDYEIKHNNITIDTGTTSATDANGQATISYTGTGIGEVEVIVSMAGMSLQETYKLIDAKYYADDTTIRSWSTSQSGTATNYNSDYTMQAGETAYYKVSTLPSRYVFGLVQGSSYCQLQKDSSNIILYVDGQTTPSVSGSLSANDIIKFEMVSDTQQKIYINDNLVATISNHSMNAPNPMVRMYRNDSFAMEYIYVV